VRILRCLDQDGDQTAPLHGFDRIPRPIATPLRAVVPLSATRAANRQRARNFCYRLLFRVERDFAMEAKLAEFVNRLQGAAGENLRSVVLYGSAVAGEFCEGHSDLNILCLLESLDAADLAQLQPTVSWWIGEGNRAPLLFKYDELVRSAGLFAVELFDVRNHHRVLFGPDWLENFQPPLDFHRLQVARELHRERLALRQSLLAAPDKSKAHLEIMLSSVSRLCALFRHAVMAAGEPAPQTKREAVAAIAAWTGADPSGFEAILDYREGKRQRRKIDLEASLHSYLGFVELAANEVDRRFAQLR
jgi:hypothetical protein